MRKIPGKLLIIWDDSPIHHCEAVKQFLSRGGAERIHLERLPAYPTGCATSGTHQEVSLRAAFMALLFSEGRGITDLWLEKGESGKVACEGTSTKCTARSASRGKSRH